MQSAVSSFASLPPSTRLGYAGAVMLLSYSVLRYYLGSRKTNPEPAAAPPSHLFEPANNSNGKPKIRPVSSREPRGFTADELAVFDGVRQPAIYVSVKHVVFEVMPQLYGEGAPYHVYAGKEIGRALAKSMVDAAECNKPFDSEDITPAERHTLDLWFRKFEEKYPVVGWFVAQPLAANA